MLKVDEVGCAGVESPSKVSAKGLGTVRSRTYKFRLPLRRYVAGVSLSAETCKVRSTTPDLYQPAMSSSEDLWRVFLSKTIL